MEDSLHSPLPIKFLLYVCERTLSGQGSNVCGVYRASRNLLVGKIIGKLQIKEHTERWKALISH